MRLLVVEDDAQLSELLERVFREDGHDLVMCGTLAAAHAALGDGTFDVVVLDWMLPDGDGLALCAELRRSRPSLPVVMLTARGEVHDRVRGLRSGADDYVPKPFDVDELLARVEAVHRRAAESWLTRIGRLEIDRRTSTVKVDGRRLELTSREYAFLLRLADAGDDCVSRTTLLADVWNMSFDPGSGVIDVQVSRLRDKLGELSWMVETVRGRGLRLRSAR